MVKLAIKARLIPEIKRSNFLLSITMSIALFKNVEQYLLRQWKIDEALYVQV